MGMRIDVVMLISGLNPEALRKREEGLKSYASEGTDVRLVTTRNAPPSVESFAEMELAAPGILERVAESEKEGADAVVIWGGHDPSLTAARELVDVPVLGPGMASILIASALAERFALLVQLPQVKEIARRQIRDLRLEDRCTGVYPVGLPVLQLGRPESFGQVLETAVTAVEGGADAVCFGCMADYLMCKGACHFRVKNHGESSPGRIFGLQQHFSSFSCCHCFARKIHLVQTGPACI